MASPEGLERLRRAAEEAGLRPLGSNPEDPVATDTSVGGLDLPADDRAPWLICEMCIRTMRKKARQRSAQTASSAPPVSASLSGPSDPRRSTCGWL